MISLGAFRRDGRGNLVVAARIARTGVQDYGDHVEYRDAAEVFDPRSMATFEGVPVTVGHVAWIDMGNVREHSVGYAKNIRRDGIHLAGDLVIFEPKTIAGIESMNLVELSAGYSADLDETPGRTDAGDAYDAIQKNIVANHIALLPKYTARCGTSCSVTR